MVKLTEITR